MKARSIIQTIVSLVAAVVLLSGCGGGGGGGDTSSTPTTGPASDAVVVKASVVSGGGSVTPASQDATTGGTASVTVTPADGYSISAVMGYGCSGTLNGNTFTINSIPIKKCIVLADFRQITSTLHNIAVSTSPAGVGSLLTGGGTYSSDRTPHVYASNSNDYDFVNWTENGVVVSTQRDYTFVPSADRNLVANYALAPSHVMTANAGAGGSIAPASQVVSVGRTALFTISPAAGYAVDTVTGCTGSLDGLTYRAFMDQQDCTIQVSFKTTATVQAYVRSGIASGSISAGQVALIGSKAEFTLYPATGYYVSTISGCNGTLNGNTYTTDVINGDCIVNAEYSTNQLTLFNIGVSAYPVGGGSATGGGTFGYDGIWNQVGLYAEPAFGYVFKNWTELGQEVSKNPWYVFYPTAHRNLVANFEPVSNVPFYDMTIVSNYGTVGWIPLWSKYNDIYISAIGLNVTPYAGYKIQNVSGCGGTLNSADMLSGVFEVPSMTADCTVTATFIPQ